jgi:hypothetical protein
MMRRRVGLIVFLLGLLLAGWIAYTLLIERRPQAASQNAVPGVITSLCLIFFGFLWMKR